MTTVTAECVGCHKRREIAAGEIAAGDMPMCDECFMPMIAVKAQFFRLGILERARVAAKAKGKS